jgi:hypothetical protein
VNTEMTFNDLELWAPYDCIIEAKFHGDPRDFDVPPSPIVADLANRIVDVLAASAQFGSADRWSAWRQLTPEREEWSLWLNWYGPRLHLWRLAHS